MKEHFQGEITELVTKDGTILHNVLAPVVICKGDKCLPIDMLVDTGADKSMISYKFGNELGLQPPAKADKKRIAYDANNREISYIIRKVDLHIGNGVEKKNVDICWCTSPRINKNFLGMDFFNKYKLIIVGGKKKTFYITKIENCVNCKKE